MPGVLYIVATPIGNLDDISLRAIAALKAVDLIAAEDTRHSRQLLQHHGIDTPLLSCHEHNEDQRSGEILQKIADGMDVALISDAGTPLISDPGFRLVRAARERGIQVSPIPGPSSVIAALCAAGLPSDRFYFGGFLASRAGERGRQLEQLKSVKATLLLFESGRRIVDLLQQIDAIFGERQCVVAKELTKLHENFLSGSALELRDLLVQDEALRRGEFVVLIDNGSRAVVEDDETGHIELLDMLLDEVSVKIAVKIAMRLTGRSKNELYPQALKLREKKFVTPVGK